MLKLITKILKASSSEIPVITCQVSRRLMTGNSNHHNHPSESPKSW